jgi:hypothetical protein
VEPDPKLRPLYAACGPTPPAEFPECYIGDPDWRADWTVPLTRYERGLRTLVFGVNDAKAHESWKRRGFEARNRKAIDRTRISFTQDGNEVGLSNGALDITKLNSEGEEYGPTVWRLEQQTYREWLSGADTDDPARLLSEFVRALAAVIEAAQVDRPRWLPAPAATPEPKENWPQDEVRSRATALLMFMGLSFAEAYAFCYERTGNTRRRAWHKLQAARKGSRSGELGVPDPAYGLSQSVRQSLKPWMKDRQYRRFTRLLRTSFHTVPHLVVKDSPSFLLPTRNQN